jgi:uncharacterized membrane protein YtjA (UPF0391 family)
MIRQKEHIEMGPWLLLLILALIAFVLGFVVAAKWLFIIAVVLLIVGLLWGVGGRRRVL